jgi:polyisoprenoid-binding protein YceI
MKRLLLAALVFSAPAAAFAESYEIDAAHSDVGFAVKHLGISTVRGHFAKFSGTVDINDKDHGKDKVNVTIDSNSISTDNEKRDGHLKSPDFFDVAKYPTITFVSKSVKGEGAGKAAVTGDLTMHGVTKEVVLEVTDITPDMTSPMDKKAHRGASATATVNRQDFGVKWNAAISGRAGDVAVSDTVKLAFDVELVGKDAVAPAKK